jgi:hypothetical protein
MAQPMYLTQPGVPAVIQLFGGDPLNAEGSLYDLLESIRFMDAFKKAEDPKKIEMFGNYLKDEARTWFHQVDWKDITFGDKHTPGSFVHRFLHRFLNVTTIYHLKQNKVFQVKIRPSLQ